MSQTPIINKSFTLDELVEIQAVIDRYSEEYALTIKQLKVALDIDSFIKNAYEVINETTNQTKI
jgi:hypothetical protein